MCALVTGFQPCALPISPYELASGELWDGPAREALAETVIAKIARHSPDFRDLILHKEVRTPWDIEREVGLTEGNIFQGELTFDQMFFNRPVPGYADYRTPIRGLYLCGSSSRSEEHTSELQSLMRISYAV